MTTTPNQPPDMPPTLPPQEPQMPPASSGGSSAKLVIIIVSCVVGGGVLLIGLLMAALLPSLTRARQLANKAACASNLNGMGKGMALYMTENDDRMPLIKTAENDVNGANSAPTPANQTDSEYFSGEWETTLGDQAMQNVWLMVEGGMLDHRSFRCPGDSDYVSREDSMFQESKRYGWVLPTNYSYGMHWPYKADAAGNENPLPLMMSMLQGGTVIMADRNPGGPVGEDGRKHSNHPKNGTGYLTFGGSAGWIRADDTLLETTDETGQRVDYRIYTNAAGVAGGLPQSATDTSIALSGRE